MRLLTIALLVPLLPLAGCLGGPGVGTTGIFAFQPIERGDPTPQAATDCVGLLQDLNQRADRQARVALHQSLEDGRYRWFGGGDVIDVAVADEASGDGAGQAAASGAPGGARDADVTGTNNQETGVDEADLLKTDGEWTYVVRGTELFILHSDRVGDIEEHARVDLGGKYGSQLLLADRGDDDPSNDRLVVIGHGGDVRAALDRPGELSDAVASIIHEGYRQMTQILVFDLADRSDPELIDEVWIEGYHAGARLVDGVAHIVVHAYEDDLGLRTWSYPEEEDLRQRNLTWREYHELPQTWQRSIRTQVAEEAVAENRDRLQQVRLRDHLPLVLRGGSAGVFPQAITDDTCRDFHITDGGTGRSVTTIHSIDLDGATLASQSKQIVGGRPIVYGAQDALVLAAPSQDTWWFWAQPDLEEATDLHWFDLDGLDVTHRASGRIDGTVQDQFGIDVHDSQLRVATTTGTWGRWWVEDPEPMMNHLAVFRAEDGKLALQGKVGGIAPDERLWSARFTDDRAYLVTFEQIDPLWIIDLADPSKPTILGELEIPGVSTYIHPIDDDTLLTIGLGPGPDGQGLDWSRIQVSLFDISDPAAPRRADVMDLTPGGTGWSWSGAVHEHKAFTYWGALDMLAVPVASFSTERVWSGEYEHWVREQHVGLKLIDVDVDAGELSLYGEVDQDHLVASEPYGYRYGADIQRSYFLGFPDAWPAQPVSVYAMSGAGMTAHDLATLELQGSVAFSQ